MESKSLDSHQDTPWKTHEFSYTEEVAGSSPVPPTRLGAVPKGQPPWCNLKVLGFQCFALDRTPSTMFWGLRNPGTAT